MLKPLKEGQAWAISVRGGGTKIMCSTNFIKEVKTKRVQWAQKRKLMFGFSISFLERKKLGFAAGFLSFK